MQYYNKKLMKFAKKVTNKNEDAEDMYQEALIKYITSKDEIRDDNRWLASVIKNSYYKFIRDYRYEYLYTEKKYLSSYQGLSENELDTIDQHAQDFGHLYSDFDLDNIMTEKEIRAFAETLPVAQKEAFVCRLYYSDKFTDIGKYLGKNHETVKRSWREAWLKYKEYAYGEQ